MTADACNCDATLCPGDVRPLALGRSCPDSVWLSVVANPALLARSGVWRPIRTRAAELPMAEGVACPLVAYSDTGSGDLLNIDHTVRYEAAEAHAIVCKANTPALEDHPIGDLIR